MWACCIFVKSPIVGSVRVLFNRVSANPTKLITPAPSGKLTSLLIVARVPIAVWNVSAPFLTINLWNLNIWSNNPKVFDLSVATTWEAKVKVISFAFPVKIILLISPIKDLKGRSTPTLARAKPSPDPTLELVLLCPPPPPAKGLQESVADSKTIASPSIGVTPDFNFFPNNLRAPNIEPLEKKPAMVIRL